jgi:calcium-dependent protein kinase
MELCTGGELFDKIINLTKGGFSERVVAKLMKQIGGAVFYMHEQRIAHRDLKPENFLLVSEVQDMEDAVLKVIDFGFSTRFEQGGYMSTRTGTSAYIAPEVIHGRYTEACDVWSVGVIIFMMLSGAQPFFSNSEAEVLAKVKSCAYNFNAAAWASASEEAKDLIRRILVTDVSQRLTAQKVVHDQWMGKLAQRSRAVPQSQEVLSRLSSFAAFGKFKKAALTALAQQLSEDSISTLRQVFEALDENEDAVLTVEEVQQGLKAAGVDTCESLHEMLRAVDSDGSGVAEYPEFLAATLDREQHMEESVCRAAFQIFDRDGDGKITKDEIAMMLSCGRAQNVAIAEGSDVREIERAVVEADADGDHCINFEEFVCLLRGTVIQKSIGNG